MSSLHDVAARVARGDAGEISVRLEDMSTLGRQLASECGSLPASVIGIRGDVATVWFLHAPNTALDVRASSGRQLNGADFALWEGMGARIIGNTTGRESWWSFLARCVSRSAMASILLGSAVAALIISNVATAEVSADLAATLLTVQGISVGLFAVFIAPLDSTRQRPYVASGRYRRWMTADTYIAVIGYAGMAAAASWLIASHATPKQLVGYTSLAGGFITLSLLSLSAYLMVGYHLTRASELTELEAMYEYVGALRRSEVREIRGSSSAEQRAKSQ